MDDAGDAAAVLVGDLAQCQLDRSVVADVELHDREVGAFGVAVEVDDAVIGGEHAADRLAEVAGGAGDQDQRLLRRGIRACNKAIRDHRRPG